MLIKVPEPNVDKNDPYAEDALSRQGYGDSLIRLAKASDQGLVVSVNAPWGEGKTTFVKMLSQNMRDEEIKVITIDAFKNDHVEDPFLLLTSYLTSVLDENSIGKEFRDSFRKTAINAGKALVQWGTKTGIKAATLGILNDADYDGLKTALVDATSDSVSSLIESKLDSFQKNQESMDEFRKSLESAVGKIREKTGYPVVVIIDELDRCRPTFAVELIERVKHFFEVPGMFFLLMMNKNQILEYLRSLYGEKIEAEIYLQKFIDIESELPKRRTNKVNDYEQYVHWAVAKMEFSNLSTSDVDELTQVTYELCDSFDLSMRDVSKILQSFALLHLSLDGSELRLPTVMVFLALVKVTSFNNFSLLTKGLQTLNEVWVDLAAGQALRRHGYEATDHRLANYLKSMSSTEADVFGKNDKNLSYAWHLINRQCSKNPKALAEEYVQSMNTFNF